MNTFFRFAGMLALWGVLCTHSRADIRIKDITTVRGARSNQLYGVGLVMGLDGTGARLQSLATQQMAIDMLRKMGITSKIQRQQLQDNVFVSDSISMVMVTAELSPFSREGSRLDVTVSVMDTASSLKGGTLLLTPLQGADGEVYAVAQGTVSLGGVNLSPFPQLRGQRNHPTSGRIPNGAVVEREALGQIESHGQIQLLLRQPDYSTAQQIASAINTRFATASFQPIQDSTIASDGGEPLALSSRAKSIQPIVYARSSLARKNAIQLAHTIDAGTVEIAVPPSMLSDVVGFVSNIGLLEIVPDTPARIVINERTGTVVVGHQVKIDAVAIAHGSLVIKPVNQSPPAPGPGLSSLLGIPAQPAAQAAAPFQQQLLLPGELPPGDKLNVLGQTYTVAELAQALNALGVTPKDLIAIFESLRESGALHAELVIM